MRDLLLATSNPGKLRELAPLLGPRGFRLHTLADLGLKSPEETGGSFVENALLKARHGAVGSDMITLAEDSGLCVPALQGAPGLYSARFAGPGADDAANNCRLLAQMAGLTGAERDAYYTCAMVWMAGPRDHDPRVAQGQWWGRIVDAPIGDGGFGYDPLFMPRGKSQTAAELPAAVKAGESHRAQALSALLSWLDV